MPVKKVDKLDEKIQFIEVRNSLKNLKNNKAPGENGISNEFLKNLPDYWVLILNILFNKIIEYEYVPDSWSKIIVTMLYKNKGCKLDPENYRPIALMNSLTKVFTGIVNVRLNEWCEKENILQSGFRKNRGCVDNIFCLNSIIQIRIQKQKGKLYALFVDFKSAFPSVDHNLLWKKLTSKGVSSKIVKILSDL